MAGFLLSCCDRGARELPTRIAGCASQVVAAYTVAGAASCFGNLKSSCLRALENQVGRGAGFSDFLCSSSAKENRDSRRTLLTVSYFPNFAENSLAMAIRILAFISGRQGDRRTSAFRERAMLNTQILRYA